MSLLKMVIGGVLIGILGIILGVVSLKAIQSLPTRIIIERDLLEARKSLAEYQDLKAKSHYSGCSCQEEMCPYHGHEPIEEEDSCGEEEVDTAAAPTTNLMIVNHGTLNQIQPAEAKSVIIEQPQVAEPVIEHQVEEKREVITERRCYEENQLITCAHFDRLQSEKP